MKDFAEIKLKMADWKPFLIVFPHYLGDVA